jgi:chromatin structure-remodeling complex subunit RSC9
LEALTAKGGDLLNRTVENYARQTSREAMKLANGQDSDDSENEESTPKEDKMDVDEPTSSSGRLTRGTDVPFSKALVLFICLEL